jgi:integrase
MPKEELVMGYVYKLKNSKKWYIQYYRNGERFQQSTGTTVKAVAERILKSKEGQIAEGKFPGLRVERTTFDELAADYLNDYKIKDRKSLSKAKQCVKNLAKVFGGRKITNITSDAINAYILKRKGEKVENSTINRDIQALGKMFTLGQRHEPPKVIQRPHIGQFLLSEKENVRKGFFQIDEYVKMMDALPEHVKPAFTLAYRTGMRKGEILSKLTWDKVDLTSGKITLEAEDTKNEEAKIIPLSGETLETIMRQKELRDRLYPKCPFVFFYKGRQMKDFRAAWDTALRKCGYAPNYKCKDCGAVTELPDGVKRRGLPCHACKSLKLRRQGKIFHDCRRSGVRNMKRAGIPDKEAMMISGHKTPSVFQRYNIVDEDDLRREYAKADTYHKEELERLARRSKDYKKTITSNSDESEKEGEKA